MTNAACESQKHSGLALYWERESQEADAIVRQSNAHEDLLCEAETLLNKLIAGCLEAETDFRMFEARLVEHWSEHPDQYDRELHDDNRELDKRWRGLFSRCIDLIDRVDGLGLQLRDVSGMRDRYATMLSIEQMRHGKTPDWVWNEAEKAASEYRNGLTEEWPA